MIFAQAITLDPQPSAPEIRDGAMSLRAHTLGDLDAFWAFYQTDRSVYVGKPKNKTHLWYGFGSEVASWTLRGFGAWAIDVDGRLAGQVSIMQPPHFPEIEIGWILMADYEGRGLAERAARLALGWYWGRSQQDTLVSYIDPRNDRSIALAQRLGATQDKDAKLPDGETARETIVYRHRRPQ